MNIKKRDKLVIFIQLIYIVIMVLIKNTFLNSPQMFEMATTFSDCIMSIIFGLFAIRIFEYLLLYGMATLSDNSGLKIHESIVVSLFFEIILFINLITKL